MPEQTVDLNAVLGDELSAPAPAGELDAVDEQLIARLAGRSRVTSSTAAATTLR